MLLFLPLRPACALTAFLDDHGDSEKENVDPVSIPMPSAPRKQRTQKKRVILAPGTASNDGLSILHHFY